MRKRTRKLSAILLTAIMIFATMAIPVSATVDQVFRDVPESAWYYGYVMMLYEKGIVGGFGTSGEFRPNNKLTREQAAKMIARAADLDYEGKKANFPDVNKEGEMSPYIAALVDAGATQGFPDGTFRPKANIKRGHAAKMVGLAFGLKEGEMTQALTDLPADAGVATAIEILASNGIVKGYKGSQDFKPNEEISRAEISKIICIAMVVTAIQKAEEEPSPENLEAAQALIEDLPPEQGDSATLDYLTERLEVLEEAEALSEVQVIGLTQVGIELEAKVDPPHAQVTYQWQSSSRKWRDYTDIPGANQKTYLLTTGDLDRYIRVKVEADKGFRGSLESRPRGPIKQPLSTYVQEFRGLQRDFMATTSLPHYVEEGGSLDQGPTEAELVGNPPIQWIRRTSEVREHFYPRLWHVVTVDEQPPGSELQLWLESRSASYKDGEWIETKWYRNIVGRYGPGRWYQYTPDFFRTDDLYAFANKPGKYTLTFRLMEDDEDDFDWRAIVHEMTITLNFVAP